MWCEGATGEVKSPLGACFVERGVQVNGVMEVSWMDVGIQTYKIVSHKYVLFVVF